MATVDELRNEIRVAVDRYERVESTAFTKEALAAICGALGEDVDTDRLPSKGEMRGRIRQAIGETDEFERTDRAFRKAELEAIAAALDEV
jgi:hypothetical protein